MGKDKKFKKPQTKLVFDNKERVEYLTGFRKRKLERKVKAKEDMEKELRKAKVKIRSQQKTKLAQLYANDRPLPEIEHLIEPIEVHDIGDAIVTISSMDTRAIGLAVGLINGPDVPETTNTEEEQTPRDGSEVESSDAEDIISSLKRVDSLKGVKKSLEKERNKLLKGSKLFKKKVIMDKIKKQKQSMRMNKMHNRMQGKKKGKKTGKRLNRPNQK